MPEFLNNPATVHAYFSQDLDYQASINVPHDDKAIDLGDLHRLLKSVAREYERDARLTLEARARAIGVAIASNYGEDVSVTIRNGDVGATVITQINHVLANDAPALRAGDAQD